MIGLLGKKIGMAQLFAEDGRQVPVTLLEVGPCLVTDIKSKDKHGYTAVQLGFQPVKEKHLNQPLAGFFKKRSLPLLKFIREIRTKSTDGLSVGAELKVDHFAVGDFVDIEGVSIGRGFQGVVKRHHFKGGERAHGSKFGREAGSIGQGNSNPSRVPKGRKMAGQLGNKNVTTQNLKVIRVDLENNVLAVRGAVPGYDGNVILVRSSLKRSKEPKWKIPEQAKEKENTEKQKQASEGAEKQTPAEKAEKTSPKPAPEAKSEKEQSQKEKS